MAPRRSAGRALALFVAVATLMHVQHMWPASPKSAAETPSHGVACQAAVPFWKFDSEKDKTYRCSEESETIRHPLHIGVYMQRIYDHWVGPVDLSRQGLRIGGMENYAICASVLLQVLVGFYAGVQQPEDDVTITQRMIFEVQMALLMAAVLASTFTMVMFLLTKICSVTALGMYKDVGYATFRQATRKHRDIAFWSIIVSVVCFIVAFAIDLLRRVKGPRGLAAKVCACAIGAFMLYAWADLMYTADDYIFAGTTKGSL